MYVCMCLPLSVYVRGAAFNVDNNELLPTSNFRLFYSAFVFFYFFVHVEVSFSGITYT